MNMFKVTNSLYKTLYFSPALGTSSDLNFPFHFSTLYSLECFTERETLQLHKQGGRWQGVQAGKPDLQEALRMDEVGLGCE